MENSRTTKQTLVLAVVVATLAAWIALVATHAGTISGPKVVLPVWIAAIMPTVVAGFTGIPKATAPRLTRIGAPLLTGAVAATVVLCIAMVI